MAVTVADAAVALRLVGAPDETIEAAVTAILTRQIAVADALVESHAPTAPTDVKDEAIIRLVAFLFDQDPALPRSQNPMIASGAGAVLAPWHVQRLLGATVEQAAQAAGITGAQVVQLLTALQGAARLPATAVRDLPAGGGGPVADGSVTLAKLATDARDVLDNAVQVDGVELTGDDLTFSSDGGDTTTIDLEGAITGLVADWAEASNTDAIPANKLTNAPSSGGGLTQSQVDARIRDRRPVPVPPINSGNVGQVLTGTNVMLGGLRTAAWQDAPSGGLSQSQVDARINNAIPVARRVPSFAAGDAGEYVRVNSSGTGLVVEPLTATPSVAPTQAQVYARAKDIVQAGRGVAVAADDAADTLTLSSVVASGNELPASPSVGDRFRLLMDDTVTNDLVEYGEDGENITQYQFTGAPKDGPQYIIGYSLGYGNAALNNKVFLVTAGTYTMPSDAKVVFYREGAARAEYEVSDTALSSHPHFYEIAGLAYGDVDETQSRAAVNFLSASTSDLYPDTLVEAGDLTFAGGNHGKAGWVRTPGVAAPWATQGQPEPRTLLAITKLHTGTATGVAVTNSSSDVQTTLNDGIFSPNFDLDDTDKQAGIIEVEAVIRLDNRSSVEIGFDSDTANPTIEARLTGFVYASSLRAATTFSATARNGISVGSVAVRRGSATLGTITLYLTHDGNNLAAYNLYYDGMAQSVNFNIALSMEVAFLHNDAPSGMAGGVTWTKILDSSYTGSLAGNRAVGSTRLPEARGGFSPNGPTLSVWFGVSWSGKFHVGTYNMGILTQILFRFGDSYIIISMTPGAVPTISSWKINESRGTITRGGWTGSNTWSLEVWRAD